MLLGTLVARLALIGDRMRIGPLGESCRRMTYITLGIDAGDRVLRRTLVALGAHARGWMQEEPLGTRFVAGQTRERLGIVIRLVAGLASRGRHVMTAGTVGGRMPLHVVVSVTRDDDPDRLLMTWDTKRNPNTQFIADFKPPTEFASFIMEHMRPVVLQQSRRLDYIFFRPTGNILEVTQAGIFGDEPHEGRMCSDHFGIYASFILN